MEHSSESLFLINCKQILQDSTDVYVILDEDNQDLTNNNVEEGLVVTFSSVTLHGKITYNKLSSDETNWNTSKFNQRKNNIDGLSQQSWLNMQMRTQKGSYRKRMCERQSF